MNKFDNMWSFAKAHPFISLWALQAVTGCVVGVTKALTRPFVKTPEYSAEDLIKAVIQKLNEDATTETDISDPADANDENSQITLVEVTE